MITPHPDELEAGPRAEAALDDGDPITYHVTYFLHFVDDRAMLRAVASDTPDQLDAHHLARGGDALLATLAGKLKKIPRWRKRWLADELRVLGGKRALAIAGELAPPAKKPPARTKKSPAKKQAR